MENLKCLIWKKTGTSHEQKFNFSDNPLQNIFGKVKTLWKIGQGQKALIPVFAEFLIAIAKYIFLEGKLCARFCPSQT